MGLALHAERPLPAALAGLDPDESRPSLAAAETLSTERARPNFYARFRRHDEADVPAAPERTGRPSGERPEIPLQGLENVVSAPESPLSPPRRGEGRGRLAADAHQAPPPGLDPGANLLPAIPGSSPGREKGRPERPENPTQGLENVDSGLGGWAPAPLDGSPSGESAGPMAAAGAPLPMEIERLDPEALSLEPETQRQGDARPQNPPQQLEIMDSRSGNGGLEPVAPPPPEFPVVGVRVPTPDGGFKIVKVRMTPNGAMAA